MKKYKLLALTLSLGIFTESSFAAGAIELISMPFEAAVRHLKSVYNISTEEAEMMAGTLIKGTEFALGRNEAVRNADELRKLVNAKGNEALKAAFDKINVNRLEDITPEQLGTLANDIGGTVDTSARASVVDVCRSCGITDVLINRFGLKLYIPREVDTEGLDALKGIPMKLHDVKAAIAKEGRGVIKLTDAEIDKAMKERSLTKHDLRKLLFTIRARGGSYGPEAKLAAEEFLQIAADKPIQNNRMAFIIADFSDTAENKAFLNELGEVTKKVNDDPALKTPQERNAALCKHFAGLAKGNPANEANFKQLQKCANYAQVFTSCAL